jgi:hypothetical protein
VDQARSKAAKGLVGPRPNEAGVAVTSLKTPAEIFVHFDSDRSGLMVRAPAQLRSAAARPSLFTRSFPACTPRYAMAAVQSPDEFEEVVKYMGLHLSKQRIAVLIARADKDGDGSLNADEFEKAYKALNSSVGVSTLAIVASLCGLLGFVGFAFAFCRHRHFLRRLSV